MWPFITVVNVLPENWLRKKENSIKENHKQIRKEYSRKEPKKKEELSQ